MGPIMKVKHFRIHAVTDQTILFNWALIYAPDGIGVPQIHPPGQYSQIAEPQQFCDCFEHLSCFSFKREGLSVPKVLQPTRAEPEPRRRDLPEDERS